MQLGDYAYSIARSAAIYSSYTPPTGGGKGTRYESA